MTTQVDCYHCGDSVPGGRPITAAIDGHDQPMCCIGCKAVAEFISHSGLTAFYDFRSPPHGDQDRKPEESEWQSFDTEDLLGLYVQRQQNIAEATIDIGGMYCSACVWLLNKALQQVAGIESIDVNPAVRRAVIRWDADVLPFSRLLETIAHVGFRPAPIGLGQIANDESNEYRIALKRLIVAAAAGMQVMMFAVALYAGDYFGIDAGIERFLRIISLLVSVPIISYAARPFFISAWRGLRAMTPNMDLPVSIAISSAFVASAYATWSDRGDIYFDSVAMFVFFLSATRFLEMRTRHRSHDHTTALAQLLPDTALQVKDGVTTTVALQRIQPNDAISIRPGDVIPIDGRIVSGQLSVDESMLTGEPHPVRRTVDDALFAGAINRSGSAIVKIDSVGASTSLAEIGRMLDRAAADRPPAAILADRIASYFVAGVLALTAVTALFWYLTEPARAFEIVLATLVVTCPCALALATPAALAAAASQLAKRGFLLVRSRVLDVLSRPSTIIFDKTGTLTEGRPGILNTRVLGDLDSTACARLSATLESASEHVLARAFSQFTAYNNEQLTQIRTVAGAGVEGFIDGKRYRIGSATFVAALAQVPLPQDDVQSLHSHVYLGDEQQLLAHFTIGDALRSDAVEAIARLRDAGFETIIASGDRAPAVREVAAKLGIEDWHAELSPAGKLQLIEELQRSREVVMVGDGINDAPVLAAADGSIALDAGTALARASADAVSLGRQLGTIENAARIARQTRRVVRQNIAWAIGYNLTAVPLAVSGFLAPWMAAVGMSVSSLVVVLNALRLQRVRKPAARAAVTSVEPQKVQRALP